VARNQSFEGQYVLMAFDADLTPEDRAFLVQTGFAKAEVKYGDRTGSALRYFGTVYGKRYEAAPLKSADKVDFSRRQYLSYVEQETLSGALQQGRAHAAGVCRRRLDAAGRRAGARGAGRHRHSCRAGLMGMCFYK
jgi:hypothetical protein